MSRSVSDADAGGSTQSTIGPVRWMSPESIEQQTYSERSDVWAFGCAICEIITGQHPYFTFAGSLLDLAQAIKGRATSPLVDLKRWMEEHNKQIPKWLLELLGRIFVSNSNNRPTFREICGLFKDEDPDYTMRFENEIDDVDAIPLQESSTPPTTGWIASRGPSRSTVDQAAPRKDTKGKTKITEDEDDRDVSNVELLGDIGSGSFGSVSLAKMKGKYVAVKRITDEQKSVEILKEAQVALQVPPSRNVCRIYGVSLNKTCVSVVMELAPLGSLDAYIERLPRRSNGLPEISDRLLFRFALGIARGMEAVSEVGIVHRDLAARNILIDSFLEPKVADFGMAKQIEPMQEGSTKTDVGPVRWMAPEAFNLKYSELTDVWSYGCTIVELAIGEVPYKGKSLADVAIAVTDGLLHPISHYLQLLDSGSVPLFIAGLLRFIYVERAPSRPRFSEIVLWLLRNAPSDVLAAENRRDERREKRQKILAAVKEIGM
jgi:serine/threonine protein kinase